MRNPLYCYSVETQASAAARTYHLQSYIVSMATNADYYARWLQDGTAPKLGTYRHFLDHIGKM